MRGLLRVGLGACLLGAAAIGAGTATAHERRAEQGLQMTVGWATEPAFAGSINAVQLVLLDGTGAPIRDLGDGLKVEVRYGDRTYGPVVLQPAFGETFGRPGEYRAPLVPSRPGTYTFHFTGTVHGQAVDQSFTSSETTFHDVRSTADVEFPARDPSRADLSAKLDRLSARLDAAGGRTRDTANFARTLAMAATALGALAVAVGGFAATRKR